LSSNSAKHRKQKRAPAQSSASARHRKPSPVASALQNHPTRTAAAVTGAMRERFARADAVLFDGTLFTDDEMLRSGTGQKTGRRMGHMPIDGEGGTLQALGGLNARRIFVHINNTNPIQIDGSAERRKVEAAGWQVAEDGMEIVL